MSCSVQAMCNNNNHNNNNHSNNFSNNIINNNHLNYTKHNNKPTNIKIEYSTLNLIMMNEEPKDLQNAKTIIEELRGKCRYQAEHIMKWKKAYAIQIQQHYRYQKEKSDQMNGLTSQLLLLESRLRRKQKQIGAIICQRELTIIRQQKLIDALSSRLVDHGLDTLDPSYTDFDSLNDSDSAVVLEDIDSDCNSSFSMRRKSSCGDVTIVRSISDAIESSVSKYSGTRRSNCFLRRPDILETVYSVEEDPEPQPDVAEKRDKFKTRSEKALVSSIEGQTNPDSSGQDSVRTSTPNQPYQQQQQQQQPQQDQEQEHQTEPISSNGSGSGSGVKQSQVTNFNRVMSNHRSVTKPKDVKYKRINKAKSKSLEELRGRLKHWVERGSVAHDPAGIGGLNEKQLPQPAQTYA